MTTAELTSADFAFNFRMSAAERHRDNWRRRRRRTEGAPAALQHIPAAALLEAALESEAKVATLQETYAELIQYSMTGVNATPRSRMDVPPADGSTDGDSVHAGRLRTSPTGRQTIFAWDGKDGPGDSPGGQLP
jgi:hypothetical protein